MSNKKSPDLSLKVPDADLLKWLDSESDVVLEIIVEASLPKRKVIMRRRPDGVQAPIDMKSSSPTERSRVMDELNSVISGIMHEPPVTLKAAGALEEIGRAHV